MVARIIFVHGTTVRDVSDSMGQIRARSARILGLGDGDVVAAEWGREVGPSPVDITPSLPPEYSTRAVGTSGPAEPTEAELWAVLQMDPGIELRLLAASRTVATTAVVVGADPPSVEIMTALQALQPPSEALAAAGLTEAGFTAARTDLLRDAATTEAVSRALSREDPELIGALSRSIVARALHATAAEASSADGVDGLPTASVDSTARQALVDTIANGLGAPTRGLFGDLFKKVVGPIGTKIAVSRREDFMDPLAHFLHDVTYYIAHGQAIRDVIARHIGIARRDGAWPVVVLAHSLGGIAAVDLLSDPATGPQVDLLVTVGSQAPLLYLLDALQLLSRGDRAAYLPKVPWLNIYNRADLLSFCAEQVFEPDFPQAKPITDKAVDANVPFPASHSAYWSVDEVFELIRSAMGGLEQHP